MSAAKFTDEFKRDGGAQVKDRGPCARDRIPGQDNAEWGLLPDGAKSYAKPFSAICILP